MKKPPTVYHLTMKEITKSASKIVFILMALAVVVLTFTGIVEPKDFVGLCLMAFTFYFSNKGDQSQDFLGK